MLRETIEHHRHGRLDEAEKGYREALAADPTNSEALRGLGAIRRTRGDLAESAELISRAHDQAPDQPKLLLMLGSVQLESGNIDASRSAYERALTLDPNLAGAHTALGHIAMMQGDPKLANDYFRTALRVDEDPQALSGLGTLALDAGDAETALKYLARASDLAPNDASIAYALGRGFAKRGMLAFGEQAFRNALRLRPGLPHANNALGQLLIQDKRSAEAEPYFRALQGVRGFELVAELGLADTLRIQEKLEDAVAAYQRALVLRPDHEAGFEAMIWCLGKLGRGQEVMSLINQRIAEFPEQLRWRATRARISGTNGRHADAAADWKWLSERDPQNPEAAVQLASALEGNGEFDRAAEVAEAAVKLAPGDATLGIIRVRACMRRGDNAGARELLDAINLGSANKDVARVCRNLSGQLNDRAGNTTDAVTDFREAQNGLPGMLPKLESLPANYAAMIAKPEANPCDNAPVLLIGTPGSGVERIAALLSDQPGLTVLRDRVQGVRKDGFDTAAAMITDGELPTAFIEEQREGYFAPLRERQADFSRPLVDWVPRFDAHHLLFARSVLPGTRVIVVDNDPRDALLNWLAFGWLPFAGLNDFDSCLAWLGRAIAHVRLVAEQGGLPHLVVNADSVLADPAGAGAELARFLGIDSLQPGALSRRVEQGAAGLPTHFEEGHWQKYSEALADAFGSLPGPLARES
ncbi:tetratricopeptide repeat protein [Dokdonella sp.]|uniref:tetratricopeptide repeat protein n=1 Tax=Dokdonella sp. TaxID=2291710 RepID=UPI003C6763F1